MADRNAPAAYTPFTLAWLCTRSAGPLLVAWPRTCNVMPKTAHAGGVRLDIGGPRLADPRLAGD
eukprot:2258323-Alexandrium_andersonii.AAC.1